MLLKKTLVISLSHLIGYIKNSYDDYFKQFQNMNLVNKRPVYFFSDKLLNKFYKSKKLIVAATTQITVFISYYSDFKPISLTPTVYERFTNKLREYYLFISPLQEIENPGVISKGILLHLSGNPITEHQQLIGDLNIIGNIITNVDFVEVDIFINSIPLTEIIETELLEQKELHIFEPLTELQDKLL